MNDTLVNIDPDYEYEGITPGPLTKFSASVDGKRLRIEQDGNVVELEPEHIGGLPRMADRWIRK